jgi:catechol 2,3-dioxygenase-like lactoylglutathione lyase family enzyme
MLSNYPVTPTIPITDIAKSKDFYQNTLGLTPVDIVMTDGLMFSAGQGTTLYLYQRGRSKADHTLASFQVDNLDSVVTDLSNKGVKFEYYDLPNGIKTDSRGIAEMKGIKSAWFKDPDGNILGLVEIK